MMKFHEQKQRMQDECCMAKCKSCPKFMLEDNEPVCKHVGNYLLDCKILFPKVPPAPPVNIKK